MVDTIGGTTVSAATNTINSSQASLASNYTTFLNLLTTQLKNQDPTNPLDNNQFTQQLTAMTGVQQQLLSNQLLTQMLSQGQAQIGSGAVNLIGKQVTVTSTDAPLASGKADWNYNLAGTAAGTNLQVVDSSGKVVWTQAATDNAKGDHAFSWNGKDQNGHALPDGIYSLRISAANADGTAIASTVSHTGLATGLATVNGATVLTIDKINAPLTAVTAVKLAAAA